jgi:hypothetical protein
LQVVVAHVCTSARQLPGTRPLRTELWHRPPAVAKSGGGHPHSSTLVAPMRGVESRGGGHGVHRCFDDSTSRVMLRPVTVILVLCPLMRVLQPAGMVLRPAILVL